MEIGCTWYAKRFQRTAINSEPKLLLLRYCCDVLDAKAMEFRTHCRNQASRQTIARLGARQDVVLRNRRVYPDGTFRDTVVFSLLDREWPAARQQPKFRLSLENEYTGNA